METFTISQLAHQAGVNVETVRYYERRGLLREPPRTAAGYRQYTGSDLWRLQFIARAKQLGFTLTEVAGLVGPDQGRSGDRLRSLAEAKIRDLDEQRRELATTRDRLTRLIDICGDPDSEDCTSLRITS
jgi:DNA-binding transcriptional MerR regulator